MRVCACVCVFVCVCVRACVRAYVCVRACVLIKNRIGLGLDGVLVALFCFVLFVGLLAFFLLLLLLKHIFLVSYSELN